MFEWKIIKMEVKPQPNKQENVILKYRTVFHQSSKVPSPKS